VNTSPRGRGRRYERDAVPETGQIFYEGGVAKLQSFTRRRVHFRTRTAHAARSSARDPGPPVRRRDQGARHSARAPQAKTDYLELRAGPNLQHGAPRLAGGPRRHRQLAPRRCLDAPVAATQARPPTSTRMDPTAPGHGTPAERGTRMSTSASRTTAALYAGPSSRSRKDPEMTKDQPTLQTEANRQPMTETFEAWRDGSREFPGTWATDWVWRIAGQSIASKEYAKQAPVSRRVR